MSVMMCSACDRYIDTDYYVEGFMPDDTFLCGSCLDKREVCELCEEPMDAEGVCYREECRAQNAKTQASEDRHNDPRRE